MPQVEVVVGERRFEVSCQPGEEPFLRSAAAMLDAEARPLPNQMGRMPDSQLLLMAGLMLADKAAAMEEKLRAAEARVAALERERDAAPREVEVPVEVPVEVRVEVPVIPPEVAALLGEIATEAEALARSVAALHREAPQVPA